MLGHNVHSEGGATLVGGGHVARHELMQMAAITQLLVAADGGADQVLAAGLRPDVVIGDMDSISDDARHRLGPERLWQVDEQESTDFEKCLTRIVAAYVLALGVAGPRLDHGLAVWNALVRLTEAAPCLVVGPQDVVFAARARDPLRLDLAAGTRVSLFPLAPVQGVSRGLRWPIDGLSMAPDGRIGTSNEALGPVELSFETSGMLVILPRDCLDVAIAAAARSPKS